VAFLLFFSIPSEAISTALATTSAHASGLLMMHTQSPQLYLRDRSFDLASLAEWHHKLYSRSFPQTAHKTSEQKEEIQYTLSNQ
jgi:hypothetical protein